MLTRYLFTALCFCSSTLLQSQNFTYTAELQSVTLSGPAMYALRQDDGTGFIDTDVHWDIDGTVNPAAFPSGAFVSAAAHISLTCPGAPASIYVRGTGPDDITFQEQLVPLTGSDLYYPATASANAFSPGVARYFSAFAIQWEISFDGTVWHNAGTSMNPLYVTLHAAKPESAWSGYKYYLTVFDIACRNADGATNDSEMIDMVWSDFTDHSVLRADGVPMGYYKYLFSPNVTLPNLIKYADGECYTWAQLFLACLKVHGFSQSNNYMNITADYSNTSCGSISRFLVKDWTFDIPSNDCEDLPYVNVYAPDYYTDADTAYLYDYAEVHDQVGVMGQTAANPASSFSNHQIAIVNSKYYDASYGVLYENFDDIKYGALSGWSRSETSDEVGIGIDVNGDGDLDASPDFTILRATPDLEMADFDPSIETW